MILIIDYDLGNIMSLAGAIYKLGYDPIVSSNIEDIKRADKIILPGVGAFGQGMKNLQAKGIIKVLKDEVMEKKKPILGICLGAQLLCKSSEEYGHHLGLGFIDAQVIKLNISEDMRLPHVGWNELIQIKDNVLFNNIPQKTLFYFVHSYHIHFNCDKYVTGISKYGIEFTASYCFDNIYGTQFHPEKSQYYGLELIKNFINL